MKPGSEPPRRGAWPTPPRPGDEAAQPRPSANRPPRSNKPAPEPPIARQQTPAPSSPKPAPPGKPAPPRPPAKPQPASPTPAPKQPFRGTPALISRGERLLFWSLLTSVLAMAVFLVRFRNRTEAHFQAIAVPLASAGGSTAPLLLSLANDQTGALTQRPLAFPLPQDPNTRARVVLQKLLAEYTAPGSPHPLHPLPPGAQSVDEVYLSPAPGARGQLATVDLSGNFVHLHPSGIEPETLTLLSIMATLHANLPQITEVRFLVDGEPRSTLAGHASLDQTYLAGPAQTAPSEAFTVRR